MAEAMDTEAVLIENAETEKPDQSASKQQPETEFETLTAIEAEFAVMEKEVENSASSKQPEGELETPIEDNDTNDVGDIPQDEESIIERQLERPEGPLTKTQRRSLLRKNQLLKAAEMKKMREEQEKNSETPNTDSSSAPADKPPIPSNRQEPTPEQVAKGVYRIVDGIELTKTQWRSYMRKCTLAKQRGDPIPKMTRKPVSQPQGTGGSLPARKTKKPVQTGFRLGQNQRGAPPKKLSDIYVSPSYYAQRDPYYASNPYPRGPNYQQPMEQAWNPPRNPYQSGSGAPVPLVSRKGAASNPPGPGVPVNKKILPNVAEPSHAQKEAGVHKLVDGIPLTRTQYRSYLRKEEKASRAGYQLPKLTRPPIPDPATSNKNPPGGGKLKKSAGGRNATSGYGGYGNQSGYGSGYGNSYGSGYGTGYGSGYGTGYDSGYGGGYGGNQSGYGNYEWDNMGGKGVNFEPIPSRFDRPYINQSVYQPPRETSNQWNERSDIGYGYDPYASRNSVFDFERGDPGSIPKLVSKRSLGELSGSTGRYQTSMDHLSETFRKRQTLIAPVPTEPVSMHMDEDNEASGTGGQDFHEKMLSVMMSTIVSYLKDKPLEVTLVKKMVETHKGDSGKQKQILTFITDTLAQPNGTDKLTQLLMEKIGGISIA